MQKIKNKISSIRKTHGGKFYLCDRIIKLMEFRPIYIEGFAGGMSVFLNIDEKFDKIFIFDKDPNIIYVWKALQNRGDEIRKVLLKTSYNEQNFKQSFKYIDEYKNNPDDDWYPIHLIIKNRFSRGGLGKDFAYSNRLRGGRPGDENAWINNIDKQLPRVIEKIQGVHFECGNFLDLVSKYKLNEESNAIFYDDPPYIKSSRVSKDAYGQYEMSDQQHLDLLQNIKTFKGISYISGYNSELYNRELYGYKRYDWLIANHSSQQRNTKKPRKREIVWEIR